MATPNIRVLDIALLRKRIVGQNNQRQPIVPVFSRFFQSCEFAYGDGTDPVCRSEASHALFPRSSRHAGTEWNQRQRNPGFEGKPQRPGQTMEQAVGEHDLVVFEPFANQFARTCSPASEQLASATREHSQGQFRHLAAYGPALPMSAFCCY
jgi:hypothetical protein